MSSERLSAEQRQRLQQRARQFRQRVEREGQAKGFSEMFRLAALRIEADVNEFCDRASEVFEEIEAYGQEPKLDDNWLSEVTGEKDNFFFSTDSLTQQASKLPRKQRKKNAQIDESAVIVTVEEAIQSLEDALNVSHSEDVQSWVQKVAASLQYASGKDSGISFWQLQKLTKLQPTALWLALLLGQQHWTIEQTPDEFYKTVTVKAT